jgi:hypothetical protein
MGSWLEQVVGEQVAAVLGAEFTSVHAGGTDEHDCTIYRGEEVHAFLEVTEDCDQVLQASNAHAYDHPEAVIRDLTAGSGEWVFLVDARTRVSKVEELQAIVDDLIRSGSTRFDAFEPNAPHRSESVARVGAHTVFKLGAASDRAQLVFSPASVGSFLRTDPELLVDYARDLLSRPAIQTKVDRLVARADGRTAWLAVVVSTATPPSVYLKIIGEATAPAQPINATPLPEGLDGFWILSSERRRVAAIRRDVGWNIWDARTSSIAKHTSPALGDATSR